MAHRKAGGSTRNGYDPESRRLGAKLFDDQAVEAGNILARQHGTKFHAGYDTGLGKDHTLFVKVDGMVKSEIEGAFDRKYVSIIAA